MSIIVLLSPIHVFPFFPSLNFHYRFKTTLFSILREIIITSLFRKLTKLSTNIFKIDINGISDPLEMSKNINSALILFYQPIINFIPCSPEVLYTGFTLISRIRLRE